LTTSFGSESDGQHSGVGSWLPPATIALLSAIAPAFLTDDAWGFNYLNNVEEAWPLYYYNGHVPVIPELASFALKGLPLAIQAVSYRIVPLVTMLLLYRQLRQLLAANGNTGDARLVAFAVTITLCMAEPDLAANLTFAPYAIGMTVGAAIALTAGVEYTSLRGPLELSLMKYRFLQAAEEFRLTCRGDDAVLFEDEDASPVILCRPRALAPGYFAVTNVPPSMGNATAKTERLPGILVPEPLFP
jgi:hypothetical protein